MQRLIADHDLDWESASARRIAQPIQPAVIGEQLGELEAAHAEYDRFAVRRKEPVAWLHGQSQASLSRLLTNHRPPHAKSTLTLELQSAFVELAAEDHPAVQLGELIRRQIRLVPERLPVEVEHPERLRRARQRG